MDSEQFAETTIWLSGFFLPYFLFIAGNSFRSRILTFMRAVIAIGAGWCLYLAYTIAARAIRLSVAPPTDLLALYDRDGAPSAFAAELGWVPAAFVVLLAWLVHSLFIPKLRRVGSNV